MRHDVYVYRHLVYQMVCGERERTAGDHSDRFWNSSGAISKSSVNLLRKLFCQNLPLQWTNNCWSSGNLPLDSSGPRVWGLNFFGVKPARLSVSLAASFKIFESKKFFSIAFLDLLNSQINHWLIFSIQPVVGSRGSIGWSRKRKEDLLYSLVAF